MKHHLTEDRGIFENSLVDESGNPNIHILKPEQQTTESNTEPPYSVFCMHMDNLHDASIRLKIW